MIDNAEAQTDIAVLRCTRYPPNIAACYSSASHGARALRGLFKYLEGISMENARLKISLLMGVTRMTLVTSPQRSLPDFSFKSWADVMLPAS